MHLAHVTGGGVLPLLDANLDELVPLVAEAVTYWNTILNPPSEKS